MNRICANEYDTTHGPARPLAALNKAQFVTAALANYGGNKPEWLSKLLDSEGKKWLA